MGLTNKKEEQLREQPIIQSRVWKSRNGDFIVHRTTITDIKPVAYMDKVLSSEPDDAFADAEELMAAAEA